MSEIFSNIRLVDYFVKFETQITGYNMNDNLENLNNLDFTNLEESPLNIQYTFSEYKLPLKEYKNTFDLNLNSVIEMLPTEHIYIKKPPNKFFSMIFVNSDGKIYYGSFYRIYEIVNKENLIYNHVKKFANNELEVYASKYIGLLSVNPFFVSFKNLLEEIYIQSTINEQKCFKYENILSILLYRIYLPKNPSTQVQLALNNRVYNFINNRFYSEFSLKLLFTFLSPEKIVLLLVAFMMNSVVIFFHTNMEILAPLIECFMTLIFPFSCNYYIIQNLKITLLEYLETPSGNIIFGIYKNDFNDLTQIFNIINRSNNGNLVYCDIENDKINIDYNEDMKKSDILPIQRIKALMENLNKTVNIYDKDKIKNSKNWSLCDMFASKLDYEFSDKTNKSNKKQKPEQITQTIKGHSMTNLPIGKISANNFDLEIKNLIYDFNLGLFEAYDENKHFNIDPINQDKTFDKYKFINDSKPDIKAFLDAIKDRPNFDLFIQNINYIVDIRHKNQMKKTNINYANLKIDINKTIRKGALIDNFEAIYDVIMKAFDKKKQGKYFNKLFEVKIRNTICINSPHYESLNYRQIDIFNDPFHEEMLKHDGSLPMNLIKLDFPNLFIDYKEFNYLGINLPVQNSPKNVGNQINQNEAKNSENIIFNINVGNNSENEFKGLMKDFKKLLFQHKDVVYQFYNYSSIKSRNQQKTELSNKTNEESTFSIRRNSLKNNVNLPGKEEYIRNFNKNIITMMSKSNPKVEFHICFGSNVIQSVSTCEICGKPNTIWDIRKEFQFSKNKSESQTKCKYCNMIYVPYFYVIDDSVIDHAYSSNERKEKGKKTLHNRSFDENNLNKSLELNNNLEIGANLTRSNNPNSYLNSFVCQSRIKKVEFMCFEHLLNVYVENEILANQEKDNTYLTNNRNRKVTSSLNFMANLLKGELKLRIENNKFLYFTADEYLKKLFVNKFNNENNNLANLNEQANFINNNIRENQMKNNITLAKLLKEIISRKKREAEEEKEKKLKKLQGIKQKEKRLKDNKILNIKFDIKDLIYDNKFESFSKELQKLSLVNGKKKNSDEVLTMSKQKEDFGMTVKSKNISPKKKNSDNSKRKFIKIDNKNRINFVSSLDINMINKDITDEGTNLKSKHSSSNIVNILKKK